MTHTWIVNITDAVIIEVAERTSVFAVNDAVTVAVVETVFTCFVFIACAILVHINALINVITNAICV